VTRGYFSVAQQYIHWLWSRPRHLRIIRKTGSFQSLLQRGMQWGLALHNSQGTCRSTDA